MFLNPELPEMMQIDSQPFLCEVEIRRLRVDSFVPAS
jgi:hypothetical protein